MTRTVRFKVPAMRSISALAIVLSICVASTSSGQQESPAQLLDDFIHYANIAKPDLAAAYAQELLESGLSDSELAQLLDEGPVSPERFDRAMQRALRVDELERIAAEVIGRIEQGRLDLAKEDERIEEAIDMLNGTQRQRLLGKRRLEEAGEHAVDNLLQRITISSDEKFKMAAQEMLISIGRKAVSALCVALPSLDPQSQIMVSAILGEIGYSSARPYLRQLYLTEGVAETVHRAANRAYIRITGTPDAVDLSTMFTILSGQYFQDHESLIAYPYQPFNNIWSYDPFVGLVPTEVPTEIYSEIMSMRTAVQALDINPDNAEAVALYVASNLKRQNDLPAGLSDPIYGNSRYSPSFYATVFGTRICEDVLSLAMEAGDTILVRDAIHALRQTTGGSNLFSSLTGRQPLTGALSYPDRRVQYDAALTLASALPTKRFAGDYRVVPLLASAIRTGNEVFSLVIADDMENRIVERMRLEALGFTVPGAEASLASLTDAIASVPGIDLVVVRMENKDAAVIAVDAVRRNTRTRTSPVLLISSGVDLPVLTRSMRNTPSTRIVGSISDGAFGLVIDELLTQATGGRFTDADWMAYAIESLSALKNIVISATPAYDVMEAEPVLIDVLGRLTGGTQFLVADILALLDSETAQRALFEQALSSSGSDQVALLDRVTDSVKRFGHRGESRHVAALINLLTGTEGETAEAAARVHGALNLPTNTAVELLD